MNNNNLENYTICPTPPKRCARKHKCINNRCVPNDKITRKKKPSNYTKCPTPPKRCTRKHRCINNVCVPNDQIDTNNITPNISNKRTTSPKNKCENGYRWNNETQKCELHKLPKPVIIDECSGNYIPTKPYEIARQAELKLLKKTQLINIICDLTNQDKPKHTDHIYKIRTKPHLINFIICLENKENERINMIQNDLNIKSPEKVSPEKVSPEKVSPEKASPEKVSPEIKIPNTNIELEPSVQSLQNLIKNSDNEIDSKEYNQFLFNKEKLEYENSMIDNTYDFLYPDLNDPNFNVKISTRKEFNDTKYDGKIYDIKKQANKLCKAEYELLPHQMFVKNFLSLQTPYNSLLLYHGLGTGKTCSAIGIAEEMRSFMKQVNITQRILIVASPNVQNNFRLQLFDERKLKLDGEQWNLNTCVGNSILKEINPTNIKGISKEKIISLINALINKYYAFFGYTGLAHYIQKKIQLPENTALDKKQRSEFKKKRIQKIFNNRLIIIDEVHNIRLSDDNKEQKKTASLLLQVCKYAYNMRLLLLSATPMYNSYKEIIWLTNLLNANDNRSTIKENMIFDKNGDFIKESIDANGITIEGGKELLTRKLIGYVSFVRGENPYAFPYRVYPDTFKPEFSLSSISYPKIQLNNNNIIEPLKNIPVYLNNIGEYQLKGYNYIINQIKTKKNVNNSDIPNFENMQSFGYTLLEKPLQALDIVYPNPEFDEIINNTNNNINPENIIKGIVGKQGLKNIMDYTTTELLRYNFEYKPDILTKYGRIFNLDILDKYSGKITSICKSILKSKGIVMVYSQYIDGGIVPIALALEELGFTRYGSATYTKPLFKTPPSERIDSITMKPFNNSKNKQAKYVILTGDKLLSPNNIDDLKYVTNPENKDGRNVKVILISKAASEGLDFKNIRQMHITEPWYNMNRQEQIIGRGVRNLSHCDLDFEQRNVEIYLHSTLPIGKEEPADLYVYRFAEKKSILIGNVSRIMKEVSVDCQLNIEQTNFTAETLSQHIQNKEVSIQLSSKEKPIKYKIGDKPFTPICDYKDNCEYKCFPHNNIKDMPVINHSYNEEYARIGFSSIVKRIRQLFKEQYFYKRNDLINLININKKYPKEQIDFALTRFVNNKNEIIVDKYGRNGYLINKKQFYVFQPMEITDEYVSLLERSIPIEYKHSKLSINIPDKQDNLIVDIDKKSNDYTNIINTLQENIQKVILYKDKKINTKDTDWFKHLGSITSILEKNNYKFDLIKKYAIFHYLDELILEDKLIIINYIFQSDILLTEDEKVIKKYYQYYTFNSDKGIILIDILPKQYGDIFNIYTYSNNTSSWEKEQDKKKYLSYINEYFTLDMTKINPFVYGFYADLNKKIIFKTGDIQIKNTGSVCTKKKETFKLFKKLPIKIDFDETDTNGGCVLLELLLRKLDEDNYNGKRWLFDRVVRSKKQTLFIGKTKN